MDAVMTPEISKTIEGDTGDPLEEERSQPSHVGRFQVRKLLGRGGFGIVYLAHDPQLNRLVALKMPRRSTFESAEQVAAFMREARSVAGLKHPGLISVYDVQEQDGVPYIVQEYIEGQHLGQWAATQSPGFHELTEVFVAITEALSCAHQEGLTHCDLKLSNVLMDADGRPHIADFGLAVHTSTQSSRRGERFGTPTTMAPEQVRGEGHRLDGRTDIWAVGVMMYELLANRRPFSASERAELYDQIQTEDPRPPRQWDRRVPKELERVCLKCLSKLRTDRYNTADDLRDDLLAWSETNATGPVTYSATNAGMSDSTLSRAESLSASSPPVRVIPKGLRSFDEDDADFFLDLIPGARDRDGLPDSIRFWKKRIEETDAERTFSVGLIYGPSGCGKSSLVKAGLLPRISDSVSPIFVEATAADTEVRILRQLGKHIAHATADTTLLEACTELRRNRAGRSGKTLIVIDQFEQWLHAHKNLANTQLVQAVRQSDGTNLQFILMVRDDFWMSVTHFMREIENRLIEGHNLAAIDLFSERHACRVLSAFGRAFGALPEDPSDISDAQASFIRQTVSGLANEGKVVSVRLALFAEMMKNRTWDLTSLREVGGTQGIGEKYLDETISSRSASPEHRYHQQAARNVLNTLLPELGTEIRGHMRSQEELLAASGYQDRQAEFSELLRILDGELRLITPTDPEGIAGEAEVYDDSTTQYYQLTHDYLVPALRAWLTRKQKETRRGRAELRLSECAALWNAKPDHRYLPSIWEWMSIALLTQRASWRVEQRRMMEAATRYFARRSCAWALAATCLIALIYWIVSYTSSRAERKRVEEMVSQIWTCALPYLPDLVDDLEPHRSQWEEQVASVATDATRTMEERTRAHLVLAQGNDSSFDFLAERLLHADRPEHRLILDALTHQKDNLVSFLTDRAREPGIRADELIRAATALAVLEGQNAVWNEIAEPLTDSLLQTDPIEAARWSETLVPAHHHLIKPLLAAFRDRSRPANEQILITSLLVDIARVSPEELSDRDLSEVTMSAPRSVYVTLLPALRDRVETVLEYFDQELLRFAETDRKDRDEQLSERAATAAETMLRLGAPQHEPRCVALLDDHEDPRVRTILIDRLHQFSSAQDLLSKIGTDNRPHVRQALVLGLEPSYPALSQDERTDVHQQLADLFVMDSDAGVHSAVAWVLRRWGQEQILQDLHGRAAEHPSRQPTWYVNCEGVTMVRIAAPGQFVVGSPESEPGRDESEAERVVNLDYSYSISAHEITVRQFLRFAPDHKYAKSVCPDPDCPMTGVSWSDAVDYCKWLTDREIASFGTRALSSPRRDDAADHDSKHIHQIAGEYTLPSSIEWEFAARAGTTTSRFFGESPALLADYAWHSANAEERTHPVGTLRPNLFGLFDVYGNAAEWCAAEVAGNGTSETPTRGGHYRSTPKFLRSAMRASLERDATVSIVGFRVVRRSAQ
jgi:serine/threonine protein kinase/formylglycine-generating enzyme required for sulfatase activity